MKHFFKKFLTLLLLTVFCCTAAAAGGGDFIISDGTLTEYHGVGGSVTIPSNVTRIATGVFRNNETITAVTLPDGLTVIESGAFDGCKNLVSVNFPNGLVEIADYGFQSCENLTRAILPDSLQMIGRDAFCRCARLTEVRLPAATKVTDDAFRLSPWGEDNITVIQEAQPMVGGAEYEYTRAAAQAESTSANGFLMQGSTVTGYSGAGGAITIPAGTTVISEKAFYQNTSITSVDVPETLLSIGNSAFEGCTALRQVSPLPTGFRQIGERAFAGCTSLSSFDKPALVSVGSGAFIGTKYDQSNGDMPVQENAFTRSRSYGGGFSDISPKEWYYNNVAYVYETGIMDGKSSGRFDPNGTITVAETIKIAAAVRATATGSLSQITSSSPWYQTYYNYQKRYTDIDFQKWQEFDRPVRRDEFTYLMYYALPRYTWGVEGAWTKHFPDLYLPSSKESTDYISEISTLYRAGVCTGSTDGKYHPERTITRAEAAAITARMIDPSQRVNTVAE